MSFFDSLVNFVSGGVGNKIVDTIASHFPPSMSEQEKEQMKLVITQASREYELELLKLAQQEQEAFNSRVKDLEGTASDLNSAGWPGRVILFLRGAQRPIWGFAVLYMDFMVFSGSWKMAGTPAGVQVAGINTPFDLQSSFWVINFLVLGFLFGERAMRNVMPFFQNRMGGSAPAADTSSPQSRAVG